MKIGCIILNMEQTLSERADLLLDELGLALKFQRPSLLVAVYQSEIMREQVEDLLAHGIARLGQTTVLFFVDKRQFDVPLALSRSALREQAVFFVSGLRWGGGRGGLNACRALNMRRELLVDHPTRAIFWLLKSEALRMARHAPDFWAFRHRVIEFLDLPSPGGEALHTCREAVQRSPWDAAAWQALGDAWHELGCLESARLAYRKVARLAPEEAAPWRQIGRIYLEWFRAAEAARAYRRVLRLDPADEKAGEVLAGLAQVRRSLKGA
jgi:hypothetical protein